MLLFGTLSHMYTWDQFTQKSHIVSRLLLLILLIGIIDYLFVFVGAVLFF